MKLINHTDLIVLYLATEVEHQMHPKGIRSPRFVVLFSWKMYCLNVTLAIKSLGTTYFFSKLDFLAVTYAKKKKSTCKSFIIKHLVINTLDLYLIYTC